MAERRAEPTFGLTFKRNFVLPGVVLLAAEVAVVVMPLFPLFGPTTEQRAVLVRAALPIFAGATLLWLAAMASWLAPVQRAISLRRRGEPVDADTADAAYGALGRVPLRALWLRTTLWIAVAVAHGVLLVTKTGWPRAQVATLASVVGLNAFVVNILRAGWYARVTGKIRRALFPNVDPLRQFHERYFPRLLLVSLMVGAGAAAALAAFIYYFLPIKQEQYLQVQTYLPAAIAFVTVLWFLYARRLKRPIDAYLENQLHEGDHHRVAPGPDPRAAGAYRLAQLLPYKLAAAKIASWVVAAAAAAFVARTFYRMERDNAVLMFGAAAVIIVGSALYETIWHRDTMRPLLAHMSVRHRLPVRGVRTTLSLRAKLLISFGGLIVFSCGVSLLWVVFQYKKLSANFGQTQAQLKLDWLRSELQARSAQEPSGPTPALVLQIVEEAGSGPSADGAVYYYVPPSAHDVPHAVGGGADGAPRLPWYVAARLRGGGSGTLEVDSLRLSGLYKSLDMAWKGRPVKLGAVAVMYAGYRGRGPAIQRPLQELLVFFLILFGVCAGIVVLTVGEFTTPIRQLEQRADEMARGELARAVTAGGEGDEVGRLTFALEEMRRALREKLRSTEEVNLDLEREVQRRTADLAKKNRELADALEKLTRAQSQLVRAEKMASIGQLVAGIAHEINNPVNAIVNTVNPLADSVDEMTRHLPPDEAKRVGDELRDMIHVIQRGARRTKEIVQALHNYSRTDDERIVEFDLNRGLDDSLELLRHHLKGHITVERRYGEVGRIKGHAGQLNQVWMNLLTNAAQALAGRDGARIRLSTERRDGHVVITVADNGPGIPPEILPKIFDPFFTTKEVGQGSGLGLSIVHGIVERHGGTIEVDSQVGQGTTFVVTLPVEHPEKARTGAAPATPDSSAAG